MLLIPLPDAKGGAFSQRSRLGERDYVITYRHNSRTDTWTLDLSSVGTAGEIIPVMTGKKLFCGHELLRQCTEDTRPPGTMFVVNLDRTLEPPSGNNLNRYRLVYLEPGETVGGS